MEIGGDSILGRSNHINLVTHQARNVLRYREDESVVCHEAGIENGLLVIEPYFTDAPEIVSDEAQLRLHICLCKKGIGGVHVHRTYVVKHRHSVSEFERIRLVLTGNCENGQCCRTNV